MLSQNKVYCIPKVTRANFIDGDDSDSDDLKLSFPRSKAGCRYDDRGD